MFAASAAAQSGPQVELYGYVAPRCWVANPTATPALANAPASRGRVICNQATPRLQSNLRALNADGTLERVQPIADPRQPQAQQSGRAALEIIVSPQA